MPGRIIVITGASDGLGAAAARRLAHSGETVVIVGRSAKKTAAVAAALNADSFVADFADLCQVRDLAVQLAGKYPRIDVLANNAGGTMGTREVTVDGFEKTFQINHLAPFLLTTALLDRLVDSNATVLNTSSFAHRFARVDTQKLGDKGHIAAVTYARTKLLNILFIKELHRRHHKDGVAAAAFHPGIVASNFSAGSGAGIFTLVFKGPLRRLLARTPEEGADQLAWLATSTPGVDWASGEYYADRRVAKVNKQVNDASLAALVWEQSLAMVAR